MSLFSCKLCHHIKGPFQLIRRRRILDELSLLSFVTKAWEADTDTGKYFRQTSRSTKWLSDLSQLVGPMHSSEEKMNLVLVQLASAITTGHSIQSGLESTTPFQLTAKLMKIDPDILDVKHMTELGYSAYAVMEIVSSTLTYKLKLLIDSVEALVGVTSFELWSEEIEAKAAKKD